MSKITYLSALQYRCGRWRGLHPMGSHQPQMSASPGLRRTNFVQVRLVCALEYRTLHSIGLDQFIPISTFDAMTPSQNQKPLLPSPVRLAWRSVERLREWSRDRKVSGILHLWIAGPPRFP